ncbi:hypothetical protein C942_03285 [Photobacterium marinum]|uniref:Lnb N-terminal periplasmic domain-containing protein n=1 Tax=Photobacterium marinum TaxID=1056511 RepID=L8J503_9GAMM|nr:DUF4105 domain-containing protein [Photobacterium marinum]ELR63826.1 hypothetical protein C942_03285 [Photobacterium marinum]
MKRLIIIITLLLAGCAQQSVQQVSKPISANDWQLLEAQLSAVPADVHRAIEQEAQTRISQTISPERQSLSGKKLLVELIQSADNPVLVADESFYQLDEVVSGSEQGASSFAEVLSDYLLQPDFACRQPVFARYFQQRYQVQVTALKCQDKVPFFVVDRYKGGKIAWVAPEQVSEIHLLFAGEGKNLSSSFGHVALRLVICPEDESEKGLPEKESCDTNVFEHLVLGYMAHIDEFELDTVKALSGQYNAYLFAFPFIDAYRDYAISEFREVYSLPLNLDKHQSEQMVRELADIHWRYSGEYRFFSKNCASLLQQNLRSLMPQINTDEALNEDFIRPDKLFAAARTSPLAQGDKLNSLETAEQQGYYFSSTESFYSDAVDLVNEAMSYPAFSDMESYLSISPEQRMKNIKRDYRYYSRLKNDKFLLNGQILLEELAFVRAERRMMAEGTRYFKHLDDQARIDQIHGQLNPEQNKLFDACLLRPVKQLTQPVVRLPGIPEHADIPELPSTPRCKSYEARKQLVGILSVINIGEQEKSQWLRVVAATQQMNATMNNILELNQLKPKARR